MKASYCIAAVLAVLSGPALAGGLSDPIVPLPPIVPQPDAPIDFYGGIQIGVVSGSFTPDPIGEFLGETDFEGPLYGVYFGAQRSMGGFDVAEVEGGETGPSGSPALDIAFDTLVLRASFHF